MENVVSEIEVVDEGEVARPAIERTGVGPPQATGPQTVKAPAWKIIGNAPVRFSQVTHRALTALVSAALKSDVASRFSGPPLGLFSHGAHLVIIWGKLYTVECVVRVQSL